MSETDQTVWPLELTEVKMLLEGVAADGHTYRLRTAGIIEFDRPEHLALLRTEKREPFLPLDAIPASPTFHVLLQGKLNPETSDGVVYYVERIQERTL